MSSSCKILICLVQNACRKKCCLLIQHVTLIFMFALIKYIFDCLWLVSPIFLTLIYFVLLTNKQVTFLYSQITCWLKTSPPPALSSLTTTFASLLEQRLPKKLLRWWSVISTALSRIARTLKALTIGKKVTYYRVKVIFLCHRFISNKPREVPQSETFWFPGLVTTGQVLHTHFSIDFHGRKLKLQSSWPQRKWSPYHSIDSPTWFQ